MAKRRAKDDLDFEIDFCEGVLRKRKDFIPALQLLSDAYTRKGDYKKGLKIDLKLSRLRRNDPVVFYNLACDYSLLENCEEAFLSLEKAFTLGYNDISFMLQDPDLKKLREEPQFEKLLKDIEIKKGV